VWATAAVLVRVAQRWFVMDIVKASGRLSLKDREQGVRHAACARHIIRAILRIQCRADLRDGFTTLRAAARAQAPPARQPTLRR